ncbi:unnamed protein product [Polarella glacialis]|uniref:Uncharacterized protein n=1 Tax=Polarella glacialis TaxID=89957 RepID=A0A813K2N6_POLGL|nr:unnamed protein product [Polarella glacialis]
MTTAMASSSDSDGSSSSSELEVLRPGTLGYCRLVVRGVVLATQVRVVDAGAHQTVVAAPLACAIAASGSWAQPHELAALKSFQCACTESSLACDVVFYGVDTLAVGVDELPEAVAFRTASGKGCRPKTQSLLALYYGTANENFERIETTTTSSCSNSHFAAVC